MALLIEQFAAYDLHFLFYTREPSAWLRSLYGQAVKQIRFCGSYDDFLCGLDTADIWGTLHRRLSAAAQGHVLRFFPMEDDKDSLFGTGDALFGHIGLSDLEIARMVKPASSVNACWPEPLFEVMRLLNASAIDDKALAIVRETLKANLQLFRQYVPQQTDLLDAAE